MTRGLPAFLVSALFLLVIAGPVCLTGRTVGELFRVNTTRSKSKRYNKLPIVWLFKR
jgi:hypothetical protein